MLKLSSLRYLYNEKAIDGLQGIDLEINKGEILGLMGPSGSGKSTLAKTISGQITPKSGNFENNFSRILYIDESVLNLEKSILDNFKEHAYADSDDQKTTISRMACSDLEITNYINTPINQLSTGQKQRALLGIALVSNCELVILDEPFSHLEAPLKRELVEIILPIFKEKEVSLLWISHDQNLLSHYCDQVAIMNYGKIIQIDSPSELYYHPKTQFVADFMGIANKEYLSEYTSQIWPDKFPMTNEIKNPLLIYRPEAIRITDQGHDAQILNSRFDGNTYLLELKLGNGIITARSLEKLHGACKVSLDQNLINIIS